MTLCNANQEENLYMNRKILKISSLCAAGAGAIFLLAGNIDINSATIVGEQSVAGISLSLDNYYDTVGLLDSVDLPEITENAGADSRARISTASVEMDSDTEDKINKENKLDTDKEKADEEKAKEEKAKEYENIGIANVDTNLRIRKGPGEDQKIIGMLPKDAGCYIYSIDDKGWAKIKSGKVAGYVSSEYLITGDRVPALAEKVGMQIATVVNTATLRVREEASTKSITLTIVPRGEEFEVIKELDDWVKISIDQDEGYVSKDYVELAYELKKAVFVEELSEGGSNGVSSVRASLVSSAKQYVGNPYVWGGTSLSTGADCSGFVQALYSKYAGISISRTSRAQAGNGTKVAVSSVKPGDLIFYGNGSGINHVAMYIGNGQVIHASNKRTGVKISNMYYRTPVTARRIIND